MELFHAKEKKILLSMGRGPQKQDCREVSLTSCFDLTEGLCITQSLLLRASLFPSLLFSFKQLHRSPSAFLRCQKDIANPVTWNMMQTCSNLRLHPVRIWVSSMPSSALRLKPCNTYITSFLTLQIFVMHWAYLRMIKIIKVMEKRCGTRGRSCVYTPGYLLQACHLC